MSENLPNIDDLFRKALEEHEDTPSTNVWANIDKNLDKKNVLFISEKYKKLKWVAAALLIFSAAMAMYTINTRMRNKELVRQNEINKRKAVQNAGANLGKGGNIVSNEAKTGTLPDTSLTSAAAHQSFRIKTNSTHLATTSSNKIIDVASQPREKVGLNADKRVGAKAKRDSAGAALAIDNNVGKMAEKGTAVTSVAGSHAAQRKDQQSNLPLAAFETKERGVKLNQKAAGSTDALTVETLKRSVDLATVKLNEKSLAITEPNEIVSSKAHGNLINLNSAAFANTGFTAHRKSAVKPFKGSKLSATIFYSPDFVSSRLDDDHHSFREDDRNEIKNKEKIVNSSSKGVLISYNIGKRWNLQSGLVLSSQTTEIQPKHIFARPDGRGNINYRFNCSAGYSFVTVKSASPPAPGDSIYALSSKNTLRYFSIPFAVSYNLPLARRFILQPAVGLRANFLTKGSIETEIRVQGVNEKSNLDQIQGLNSSYLNGSFSLAATYYISKKIGLSFTPVTRFALSAINKDAPVKTYLNSFGLAAGLTIGL